MEVNGPGADPLYKYLKATAPVSIPGSAFTRTSDLLWNYEKFLCDQDGVPVKRFKSPFNPADFEGDVRPPDPTQLFCPDPLHPNCSKVPLMTSFVSITPTSPMHRRPDRRPSWLHVLVVFRASMQHLVLSCQDAACSGESVCAGVKYDTCGRGMSTATWLRGSRRSSCCWLARRRRLRNASPTPVPTPRPQPPLGCDSPSPIRSMTMLACCISLPSAHIA